MRARAKALLAWLLAGLLSLFVGEAALRAYFAMQVGPRVLLYGTAGARDERRAPTPGRDPSVQSHENVVAGYEAYVPGRNGGYSKYFPHEIKITPSPDGRERYPVRINNHGFRGEDFTTAKPPGTIRVLTLGASSTFGYHDRDDETYPFYLEELLNERGGPTRRFEVINLAIPHAISENIVALFLAEGVPLQPDVVTFYEGANDSAVVERGEPGPLGAVWAALRRRLLLAEFVSYALGLGVESQAYAWSDELAQRRSRAFLDNLDRLAAECRARRIRLIVATQQMKSMLVPADALRGVTYADEVRLVRERLARGEIGPSRAGSTFLRPFELLRTVFDPARTLLVHSRMMDDLRAWAASAPVSFVDVAEALDGDRHLLVNWVHLRPEANRKIAEALANEILREQDGQRRT